MDLHQIPNFRTKSNIALSTLYHFLGCQTEPSRTGEVEMRSAIMPRVHHFKVFLLWETWLNLFFTLCEIWTQKELIRLMLFEVNTNKTFHRKIWSCFGHEMCSHRDRNALENNNLWILSAFMHRQTHWIWKVMG